MAVENENEQGAAPANDETAAAAPTPATAPAEPEPSAEETALAAMDEGLATLAPETPTDPAEPKPEAGTPAPAPDAKPEAGADPAAAAADAAKPAGADKPEPHAETEAEISKLGLKETSAERFRGMANEIRSFAPMREALKQAGIDDVARLPELVQHDKDYRDLIGMVQQTGASPEQYGQALDYLRAVNQAATGDRAAAERAYEVMSRELQAVAQMLGKPVPGMYDPLTEYPDIAAMVTSGDMTREAAQELASMRKAQALAAVGQQAAQQRQQQEHAQAATMQRATDDLNRLGAELAASDPLYAAKAPVLVAKLREMQQIVPPQQWANVARSLYSMIQTPTAAPAAAPAPARVAAKPTPGPLRGIPLRPNVMPITDDPMEALEMGIAAASQ